MKKILITGAAGGIGTSMRKLLPAVYNDIRWSDIRKPDDLAADEEFMPADLADYAAVRKDRAPASTASCISAASLDRRVVGNDPQRQYRRLPQRVRGRLSRRASSAWYSPPPIMPSAFIRATKPSASTSRRARTRATASARRSAKRSARSTPTSMGCASRACASAISATRRSTNAGWRSGSSRRTWCSSSASASSTAIFISKSSTASPTMPTVGGTTAMPAVSATSRRARPKNSAILPWRRRPNCRPIPSATSTRAAPIRSDEYDAGHGR